MKDERKTCVKNGSSEVTTVWRYRISIIIIIIIIIIKVKLIFRGT